ncbi:MAG: hypothetical protein LBK70_02035 [Clostridiales bacterium]|jgi:hypothetical protein|nr:hypothetical protein [Clostridiales bacterium]
MRQTRVAKLGKVAVLLLSLLMVVAVFVACTDPKAKDDDNTPLSAPKVVASSDESSDIHYGQTAEFKVKATHELQSDNGVKDKLWFVFKYEYRVDNEEWQEDTDIGHWVEGINDDDAKALANNQTGDSQYQIHVGPSKKDKIELRLTVTVEIRHSEDNIIKSEGTEWTHTLNVINDTTTPEVEVDVDIVTPGLEEA